MAGDVCTTPSQTSTATTGVLSPHAGLCARGRRRCDVLKYDLYELRWKVRHVRDSVSAIHVSDSHYICGFVG